MNQTDYLEIAISDLYRIIKEKVHYSNVKDAEWFFNNRNKNMVSIFQILENYSKAPLWTSNQTLTDYLTSGDVNLFLIGYELLQKEESYGNR